MIFLLSILIYVLCRASCEAVIDCYYWNSALPFVGFNTELDARSSFESFQTSGQLTPGIHFPTSVQPLNGPPRLLLPQTPQCHNKPSMSQSPVSPSIFLVIKIERTATATSEKLPATAANSLVFCGQVRFGSGFFLVAATGLSNTRFTNIF